MSTRKQAAALPFTFDDGRIQVMLITSRDTGRWIIPKGWLKKGMSSWELAELEAYEEAGLKGLISKKPVGEYDYLKRMDDGSDVKCTVTVYPLLVEKQVKNWPEKSEREYRWLSSEKAAKLADDDGLTKLLRGFSPKKSQIKKSA